MEQRCAQIVVGFNGTLEERGRFGSNGKRIDYTCLGQTTNFVVPLCQLLATRDAMEILNNPIDNILSDLGTDQNAREQSHADWLEQNRANLIVILEVRHIALRLRGGCSKNNVISALMNWQLTFRSWLRSNLQTLILSVIVFCCNRVSCYWILINEQ